MEFCRDLPTSTTESAGRAFASAFLTHPNPEPEHPDPLAARVLMLLRSWWLLSQEIIAHESGSTQEEERMRFAVGAFFVGGFAECETALGTQG